MPGIPLLFTEAAGTADLIHRPLPGLYLGEDTFLGEGIWLDQGVAEAFAEQPFLAQEGIVFSPGAPTPAEATMPMPGLPALADVIEVVTTTPAIATMPMPSFGGEELIEAPGTIPAIATMPMPQTSGGIQVILVPSVRELPPLRLHIDVETPGGRHFRWGTDENDPTHVYSGLRFSDTMPGGFETQDATLPRKPGRDDPDLERLSTITVHGAGGEIAWQGRLERAPSTSGDQASRSPSAVGYQAAMDDDKSVTATYIDQRLEPWRGGGATRQLAMSNGNFNLQDPSSEADTQGTPALKMALQGNWTAPRIPLAEAWYDAGPATKVAGILFTPSYSTSTVSTADTAWTLLAHVMAAEGSGTIVSSADMFPATTTQSFFPASPQRFGLIQWYYTITPAGTDGAEHTAWLKNVVVIGDQGLTVQQSGTVLGFFASDVVRHAVSTYSPQLVATTETVQPSGFIVPQLAFQDRTTTSEIVRQATRFGLQDWAVWENKTFWWHDRGYRGRKWRARVGPAKLEETGQAADRVWESVIVQYQDVDGSTRTVGPPGSGADTEDPLLKDTDPDNPANKAGIVRRDLLQMGTSTAAAAIEVGRRFLEESKTLDHSGRASFVGHIESEKGVLFPYWAPRAGDEVSFVDAADASYRRIVRTEKDHSSRTCSVDLDAPPEGLTALLERLGVVLVPLGL